MSELQATKAECKGELEEAKGSLFRLMDSQTSRAKESISLFQMQTNAKFDATVANRIDKITEADRSLANFKEQIRELKEQLSQKVPNIEMIEKMRMIELEEDYSRLKDQKSEIIRGAERTLNAQVKKD